MDRFPLARFNAETFSDVIEWIEFRDILRLYCTGDRAIIGMLTQPSTIREVRIIRKTDVHNAVKFPNFCSLPVPDLSRQVTCLHVNGQAHLYQGEDGGREDLRVGQFFCSAIPSFHLLSHLTLKCLIIDDDALVNGLDLPGALTALTICEVETETWEWASLSFMKKLPRGLLYLDMDDFPIIFNDEYAEHLPPGLTTLTLSSTHDNMTNAAVSLLPRSLTFLELFENTTIDDDGVAFLPPHLTHLVLYSNTHLTDRAMHLLPRTLKSLNLDGNDLISNEGVSHLPPCLTCLSMNGNTRLTSECFVELPRGLTWLDIASVGGINGEDIAHLPRNLIHLDIETGSNALNDYDILQLPRQLQFLDITEARLITDACIPHLPLSLTRLYMAGANITTAGASQLLKMIKRDNIFLPYHLEIECNQLLDNKQYITPLADTNLRVVNRLFMCCHMSPILVVHVVVAIASCVYFLM